MNLLAISYYAPPQLTPQAIQIGRQLYHLARGQGTQVRLLHGIDPQFAPEFDQYPDFFERIASLAVANPGPPLKGLPHRVAQRLLPLYGACPDLFGPWRRRAARRALGDIAARRPDALASFGMPMSDHLLALELKRRTGLPWLAHFSDPWSDNPFHKTSWLEHRLNRLQERRVIAAADRVVFTSARTLDLVMAKYPPAWRARAAVLPHAWDMARVGAPPVHSPDPSSPRRVIRHIGACYGARSPVPLFAALQRLGERQPQLLAGLCFEFIGHVAPVFLDSPAYRALPPGLVVLRGQRPYREALQLARGAAALLVIDAPSREPSVFLPSKLIEYIGARRPVWGITPPGSAADLIAEWAGDARACAAPDDLDAVVRMLLAGVAALDAQRGEGRHGPDSVCQRFAPAVVAAGLKRELALVLPATRERESA